MAEREPPKKPEPPRKKEDSPQRSPSPREKRQVVPRHEPFKLKPQIEEKKPEKKKVETRDACTQTDRSDYKKIKAAWLAKQAREQEEMRLHHIKMQNQPYKSPNQLIDPANQARKSIQSSGNQHQNALQASPTNIRHVHEMRYQA